VADIGIARGEEFNEKETTQVGMTLGTPRYMSPEQAAAARESSAISLYLITITPCVLPVTRLWLGRAGSRNKDMKSSTPRTIFG